MIVCGEVKSRETSTKYFRIYVQRRNRLFFGGTWGERDLIEAE